MHVGLVEVMDLLLEFADSFAIRSAEEQSSGAGPPTMPIGEEVVEGGVDEGKEHNENDPQPLLALDGVYQHPQRKHEEDYAQRVAQQIAEISPEKNGEDFHASVACGKDASFSGFLKPHLAVGL